MLKRATLVVGLVLCGAVSSTGKAIPNPPLNLDHFLCYVPAQSMVFQTFALLKDQFDAAADTTQPVKDLRIVRFCNPVVKILPNGRWTPVRHWDAHLTLFQMDPQPSTARRVFVRNQFGEQVLQARQAETLAVPTGKVLGATPTHLPAIPTDIDHFKCYNASGKSVNQTVGLRDQFSPAELLVGPNPSATVKVLAPTAFCNPVEKTRGLGADAIVTPITNLVAHLACYAITKPTGIPFLQNPQLLFINNQFGSGAVTVYVADTLCVPSYKLHWSVIPPPIEEITTL